MSYCIDKIRNWIRSRACRINSIRMPHPIVMHFPLNSNESPSLTLGWWRCRSHQMRCFQSDISWCARVLPNVESEREWLVENLYINVHLLFSVCYTPHTQTQQIYLTFHLNIHRFAWVVVGWCCCVVRNFGMQWYTIHGIGMPVHTSTEHTARLADKLLKVRADDKCVSIDCSGRAVIWSRWDHI